MLRPFLQHLHRGGAYAYYHELPTRRSWWFETGKPLAPPAECAANWYFGVHPVSQIPPCNAHGEIKPPRAVRAQKRFICAVNCLYAEFDVKTYGSKDAIRAHLDQSTFPIPSALIDSGGGLHAYWLLRETFSLDTDDRRAAAEVIQRLWVQTVGGDDDAKDLARILRIPGTLNLKYDPPRPVVWLECDLSRTYALQALTAHLPPVQEEAPRQYEPLKRARSIEDFNAAHEVGALLAARGYAWRGTRRMVSPQSGSKRDGVSVDSEGNRAFVHTGGDPLCDGYWKKPFDVIRILDHGGDFKRALEAIRDS